VSYYYCAQQTCPHSWWFPFQVTIFIALIGHNLSCLPSAEDPAQVVLTITATTPAHKHARIGYYASGIMHHQSDAAFGPPRDRLELQSDRLLGCISATGRTDDQHHCKQLASGSLLHAVHPAAEMSLSRRVNNAHGWHHHLSWR
jgi:hypothetical protein